VKPGKESGVSETGFLKKGVEKNQDPSIFLATYWNLLQKFGDLNFVNV
jgi:hypothetical protein